MSLRALLSARPPAAARAWLLRQQTTVAVAAPSAATGTAAIAAAAAAAPAPPPPVSKTPTGAGKRRVAPGAILAAASLFSLFSDGERESTVPGLGAGSTGGWWETSGIASTSCEAAARAPGEEGDEKEKKTTNKNDNKKNNKNDKQPPQTPPQPRGKTPPVPSLNRRRMTSVGRFSLVSETQENPSVPVLVLAMTGRPYRSADFRRLYRDRRVAEKHPRFRARLDEDMTHFVFGGGGGGGGGGLDNGLDSGLDGGLDGEGGINSSSSNSNNNNKNHHHHQDDDARDNVRDVLFPAVPGAELKCRINDASLYEPLDLTTTLWEAWTATGGYIGQSGAIPKPTEETGAGAGADADTDTGAGVESLLLFRAHHCMADGVSLAGLFGDLMDEGPEMQATIERRLRIHRANKKKTPWWKKLLVFFYYWIWGTLRALLYQVYLFAATWWDGLSHENPWAVLKDLYDDQRPGNLPTPPPRSLAWATVSTVDEAKAVAKFYTDLQQNQGENGKNKDKDKDKDKDKPRMTSPASKITINDVFCSCVSAAIARQLDFHRSTKPSLLSSPERTFGLPSMNLIIPVHLQGGVLLPGQSMGNKIGAMVSRIPGETLSNPSGHLHHTDPTELAAERLARVHAVLHERKQTPVAVLSYLLAGAMGYLSASSSSSSWTPWIFRRAHAGASVVVTNVRGPETRVHMEGRPVEVFFGFLPLPAGVPIGLTVTSYDGRIHLTVSAEEYAVPDADRFLGWVRDEYDLLRTGAEAAAAAAKAKADTNTNTTPNASR